MTRLSTTFASPRPALVCFITAGDGDTAANLDALVEAGADVIELGMPFTDPMADGPAIQSANLRSLGAGTTTADVLRYATEFRARHPQVPLVLMGYANPMVRRGPEWFAEAAAAAGVDGVICVDIPPEEDDALGPALRAKGIAPIRLATPTTDAARLPQVLAGSEGFLYYVSVAGITGKQQAQIESIEANVARIKASSDLPVAVASNSDHTWVEPHLNRLGLLDRFAFIACREDVRAPKPEPDLYKLVLENLGLRGHEAIAFEDSHAGSLAAKRAHLWCVAAPGPSTAHHDFAHTDLRVASLAEVTLPSLRQRFEK